MELTREEVERMRDHVERVEALRARVAELEKVTQRVGRLEDSIRDVCGPELNCLSNMNIGFIEKAVQWYQAKLAEVTEERDAAIEIQNRCLGLKTMLLDRDELVQKIQAQLVIVESARDIAHDTNRLYEQQLAEARETIARLELEVDTLTQQETSWSEQLAEARKTISWMKPRLEQLDMESDTSRTAHEGMREALRACVTEMKKVVVSNRADRSDGNVLPVHCAYQQALKNAQQALAKDGQ